MSLNIHYFSNNARLNKFQMCYCLQRAKQLFKQCTHSQIVSVMITLEKQILNSYTLTKYWLLDFESVSN